MYNPATGEQVCEVQEADKVRLLYRKKFYVKHLQIAEQQTYAF